MKEKEIRVPKQKRSIEKKNTLKQTALELFAEKGYHNVTSNEIAKCSGISIGTFYSYFTDKKALYEELVGDLYEKILGQIKITEVIESNPVKLIRTYIRLVMEGHAYMTAFQKEITSLSLQYHEYRLLEEKYRSSATEKIMILLSEYQEILRVTDFSTVGMILQNSLEAVIHEVQFYTTPYDKDIVIEELTDMFCRYLFKSEYLK